MHKFYKSSALFLLTGLISLFLSCSDNPIFANIQREDLLNDGSLSNEISLHSFDKIHAGSGNYYLVAGKRVWFKPENQVYSFVQMAQPALTYSNKTSGCGSLAVHNGASEAIIGAFYQSPRNGISALYTSSDPANWTWNLVQNSVTAVHPADGTNSYFYKYKIFGTTQGTFIQRIQYKTLDSRDTVINGSILYFAAAGADITDLNALQVISLPRSNKGEIEDLVYSTVDNRFYFILNDYSYYAANFISAHLMKWDGISASAEEDDFAFGSLKLEALGYIPGKNLLLCSSTTPGTKDHFLLAKVFGTSWGPWKFIRSDYLITDFLDISNVVADRVLVSTSSYTSSGSSVNGSGYIELQLSNLTSNTGSLFYDIQVIGNTFSNVDNYDSTGPDLKETTIKFMYIDNELAPTYPIWAITSSSGIWRNMPTNEGRSWFWE